MIGGFFHFCVLLLLLLPAAEVCWVVGVIGELLLLQLLLSPPLRQRLLSDLPVRLLLLVSASRSQQVAHSHCTRQAEHSCYDSADRRALVTVGLTVGRCTAAFVLRPPTCCANCRQLNRPRHENGAVESKKRRWTVGQTVDDRSTQQEAGCNLDESKVVCHGSGADGTTSVGERDYGITE